MPKYINDNIITLLIATAEVVEYGQRRWIQGPFPQGFAGSNPALRIIDNNLLWNFTGNQVHYHKSFKNRKN